MFGIPSLLSLKTTAIAGAVAFALGAAIATFGVVRWHNDRVDALRASWAEETKAAVKAGKKEVQDKCDGEMKITKEEGHALKTDFDKLSATYNRLRGQRPIVATCLPLAAPVGRADGTAASPGNSVGVGVNTEWLDRAFYDTNLDAAACQSLQRTVSRIYIENGAAEKLPITSSQ